MHEFGAGTHVGNLRDNNEDSYVCDADRELWIVADGMGGLGFGEVASAISTLTVATQVKEGHGINQAIELAHKRIKEYADAEAMGTNMGTTIVLLLSQGSLFNIFWVGDSRAYSFHNDSLSQITTDHSLVQALIEQGELTQEEADSDPRKNAVTRALGVQELETVRADSISDKWLPGQKILLCSDGLTDCVTEAEIAEILRQEGTDQTRVDALIKAALEGGGKDNITVVLVSASSSAKRSDSDTHVPEDVTDSTHVPFNAQNTMRREPAQRTPLITESNDNKQEETTSLWFNLQNWVGALAMVVAVVVFSQLTTAEKTESEIVSPTQFIQIETEQTLPVSRQGMPDMTFPEPGKVLQLGLFTRLEGAEKRQQEASQKGYVPFVEKKIVEDQVHYAVLLGPYYQNDQLQIVSAALKNNGIGHFERPES